MDRPGMVDRVVMLCKGLVEEVAGDPRIETVADASLVLLEKFRAVGRELLQSWVDDHAHARAAAPRPACPHCGGAAVEFVHTRTIHPLTLFGEVAIPLRTFHCRSGCGHFRPDDPALGAPDRGGCTDDVRLLFSPLLAALPHREASDVFRRLTGVDLSSRGAQSVIDSVSVDVEKWRNEKEAGPRQTVWPSVERKEDLRLEIAMDGVMANIDGSWQEAKVAAVVVRRREEPKAEPVRGRPVARRYTCVTGKPKELAVRIQRLIRKAGWEEIPVASILGDGAAWIWKLAEKHFPGVPQELDWFHLSEHFHAFAGEQFREEVLAKYWVHQTMAPLLRDRTAAVLRTLDKVEPRTKAAAKALRGLVRYVETNQTRIRFKESWQTGLAIGSGSVEGGGCKHLVQARFKRAGMRWSRAGFHKVMELRLAHLNGDLDEFWAGRVQSRGSAA